MAQGLSYLAVRQPIFIENKKAPGHKSLRVFFIIYSDLGMHPRKRGMEPASCLSESKINPKRLVL